MSNLRIGVPSKGRLSELCGDLLRQAGLYFRRQDRSLFARVADMPIEITFLRTDDIPVLCAEGAIDLGLTGGDLVAESEVNVRTRLRLGVGRCRLAVCVPIESSATSVAELSGKRVATSFPRVTKQHFSAHNAEPRLVHLSGSVEIMISLGVADAIVDLVETGSTLAANRLRVMEEIGSYETVLIQNHDEQRSDVAERVVKRLEGVIIARSYSLLEYNIPREALQQAEQITPGYNSPTINTLEDPNWCAVRVMVKRGDVLDTMEKLDQIGASAILETKIENCRL